MVRGKLQLEFRHQHAAALDAADLADSERDVLARDVGARRHEHALHAGPRIGRAAHDLHGLARAGVHHAHAQPVGIRMLLGRDHARDGERRQQLALVLEVLDLEPDHSELIGERLDRGVGVEMLLEPRQGEFHFRCPMDLRYRCFAIRFTARTRRASDGIARINRTAFCARPINSMVSLRPKESGCGS